MKNLIITLGVTFLIVLIIYIGFKRRDLLKVNFKLKKRYFIFFMLYILMIFGTIFLLDNRVAYFISNKYPNGLMAINPEFRLLATKFFKVVTRFGQPEYVSLIIFPVFLYGKLKASKDIEDKSLKTIIAMVFGVILSTFFKVLFMRSRPFQEWNSDGFYFIEDIFEREIPFKGSYMSFPSGHTMVAFCSYSFLAFKSKNNLSKIFFFSIAILVGFSRIYLSAHWMSDVLASAIIGITIAKLY
ncbi:MAG: phosphatase PAP2 family protein, partial [Cetobacterium sp.]